jgi:DNA-binding CsgD family transcriptional regulator
MVEHRIEAIQLVGRQVGEQLARELLLAVDQRFCSVRPACGKSDQRRTAIGRMRFTRHETGIHKPIDQRSDRARRDLHGGRERLLLARATMQLPDHTRARLRQAVALEVLGHIPAQTLDDALALAAELDDDPRAQIWAANAAGGEPGRGLQHTSKAVEIARRQGLFSLLPLALEDHAKELLRAGRLELAYLVAQEGYTPSAELGHGAGWHLATMAYVEAIRGDEPASREHAENGLAVAQRSGDIYLAAGVRAAVGLLELTLGRPAEAAAALLEIAAADRSDLTYVATVGPAADAIEAIVRGGLPAEHAEAPLALLRDWARHAPGDGNRSILARCEGLLAARTPDDAFAEAVRLSRGLTPFERARTELLYGEWLRRQRRRSDARGHLREAVELFRSIGAPPWAERAETELRATGETARKREPSTLDQLTPQELQIARLVANGLTNREIASQLFLSPRTVEYHLRKVFTKLGLASRTELIRRGDLSALSA